MQVVDVRMAAQGARQVGNASDVGRRIALDARSGQDDDRHPGGQPRSIRQLRIGADDDQAAVDRRIAQQQCREQQSCARQLQQQQHDAQAPCMARDADHRDQQRERECADQPGFDHEQGAHRVSPGAGSASR